MRRSLLDVNVIIALLDEAHVFHAKAHAWWIENAARGWASCPMTENGVARVMSHPSYSRVRQFSVAEVGDSLGKFAAAGDHQFWPDALSIRDESVFDRAQIHGGRQLTDVYLLAIATRHGGRLISFDQGITVSAVKLATPENLWIL